MAEVVTPYECEHLVASLQPLSVEEAGAEAWVAQAGAVERLSVDPLKLLMDRLLVIKINQK